MYAYIAAATGWTWEYIGERLTLPRLYALYAHWRKFPPVAVSVALYLGIKPKAPAPQDDSARERWMDEMPGVKLRRPI